MFINGRANIVKMAILKMTNRFKAFTIKNPSRIFWRYQHHSIVKFKKKKEKHVGKVTWPNFKSYYKCTITKWDHILDKQRRQHNSMGKGCFFPTNGTETLEHLPYTISKNKL